MRRPLVWFPARRSVAVVLVAWLVIGLGAETVRRRMRVPRDRAARHSAERMRLAAARDRRLREAAADPVMRPALLFDAERHRRAVAWHAGQEAEDRRAVWRPWEPVPPERPGPPLAADPPRT